MAASIVTTRGPETNLGIVTSWLPLTTAYPSLSGCANSLYSSAGDTVGAWDPGYGVNINTNVRCQPPQVTSWWQGQPPLFRYSIGPLVCPEAYSTVYSSVKNPFSTYVACCPSSYSLVWTLDAGTTGECVSQFVPGQVITYGISDTGGWTTTVQTVTQVSVAIGIPINGWNFAPETTGISAITSSPQLSNTASTSSSRTSSTLAASSQAVSETPTAGLNPTMSAIIGVCAGLGVLLIAGVLMFIFRHRRRRLSPRRGSLILEQRAPMELGDDRRVILLDSKRVYEKPASETGTYRGESIHNSLSRSNTEAGTFQDRFSTRNTLYEPPRQYHELWTNNG